MHINSLPEDCFYEIFKYISKDDTKTLYNCLFINRFLCRMIIPILYKNPFFAVNDLKQNYFLIRIYLACINEKEKNYLREHLIEISEELVPLFDYAKYLERIPDLTFAVESWFIYQFGDLNEDLVFLNYYEYIDRLDRNRKLILQEILFHLFLRKIKNCKELNVQAKLFDTSLFNFQFFEERLSHYKDLSVLHLTITEEDLNDSKEELCYKFISIIASECFNIEELKLKTFYSHYNSVILQNLIRILIQNQRNFKNIHLINPNFFFLNDIFKVIGSKKPTLTSINITNSVRSINEEAFKAIARCENLERLEFNNCRGLSYRTSKILFKAPLKLNELTLHNNYRTLLFDLPLIRKMGNTLNKLSLDQISDVALKIISRHCLNLKILKIVFRNTSLLSYVLFRNMKIEQLTIYSGYDLISNDNNGLILLNLAKNLPDSLNSFTIEETDYASIFTSLNDNNCITPDNLAKFLNNCRVNLITLNFNFHLKNDNLLKLVDYVEKRKSLKYLGIRSCPFLLRNDKASKEILNKIKEYGVEIVINKKMDV